MALFDKKDKKPELPIPPAYNPNMMSSQSMTAPDPNNFSRLKHCPLTKTLLIVSIF